MNKNKIDVKDFRIIDYEKITVNNCVIENNVKCNLETSNKYKIITNLNKELYENDKIEELYNKRWSIEVFFKCLKRNFKFANLKEFNEKDQYNKSYFISMISMHILMTLEKIYIKSNDFDNTIIKKNGLVIKSNIVVDKTLLIDGLNEIMFYIVKGQLTVKLLLSIKKYFKIVKNEVNRSFDVISITPFTKWYVKAYSNINKYNQIGKAIMNNDISVLNKNLQVIARQSSVFNPLTKLRTSLIPIIPIVVLPVIILPNLVINNAI